jgi:hypothetical protein
MSEVPEEYDPVAQSPDVPVGTEPEVTSQDPVEDTFDWNGEKYDKDSVMEVVSNFGNWKNAQASITRRNQQDAEQRREVERLKAEYEEKIAGLQDRNTVSTQEDYDDVTRIENRLNSIEGMIRPFVEEQARARQELQRESAYDQALAPFANKPLANLNEMRQYLESKNLGPEYAEDAYIRLYGYDLGQMRGSMEAKQRQAAPVLGSTGYGASTGWTSPSDARGSQRPMSETSVEDLVRQALNDPDI